jgi:hypothetical protein
MWHIPRTFLAATLALLFACSSSSTPSAGGGSGGDQRVPTEDGGPPASSGGVTGNAGTPGGLGGNAGGSSLAAGGTTGDIGTWSDGPGTCPSGMTRVDISSLSDLANASRADGSRATDPASVCYFIHNGTYQQSGSSPAMYVLKGGVDADHRRIFVGESRTGVVVKGRANIETGANHVQVSNLTFDLTGYSQSGSFNTLNLSDGCDDIRVDHVTFTGDCKTGANGGHVEVDGATDVEVEACLIEKFGRCGPNGHQDHGVYLASGSQITIRNNDIWGNASRGVLFNTQGGQYGTLDGIRIEGNRIHDNGHADYEDGIAMNATDTGMISNVVIVHNLIYSNYYSGLREVGDAFSAILIRNNTFYMNGRLSTASGRSEVNLDDAGSGASTSINRNIIVAANRVLNDCYDSLPRRYGLADNLVQGAVPTGSAGNCISASTSTDPMFTSATTADFHPQSSAAVGYGAYSD